MSGFIFIINQDGEPVDSQLLRNLTTSLGVRGPDRQATKIIGHVGMGHALFKTTYEAEHEQQPCTLDNKIWLVGSARIDGREQLISRMGLTNKIDPKTTSDSTLILHAHRYWGTNLLEHLLGDFSFVIWDSKSRSLIAARDRFGMRQLCYAQVGQTLILGNSINCLLQHPKVRRNLNDQAMGDFLLFGDHTWLDKTVTAFADIHVVPPAHKLTLTKSSIFINRYWDIQKRTPLLRYRRPTDYIEHFSELLSIAVKDRIRTNKVVISMSGGMDSPAIAANVCTSQCEYSAVTAVYDHILPCKERYYTGIVAKKLGIPINFVSGDHYPLLSPGVATTRPLELETPAYWLKIKQTIAQRARVVLMGASADNLLEYSPVMTGIKETNPLRLANDLYLLQKRYGKLPSFGTGLLTRLKGAHKNRTNPLMSAYSYPSWFNPDFEQHMNLRERWSEWHSWQPHNLNERHPRAHASLTGADWNTDDICMDPEFTLAEERDPYLDLRLVEFIFSIPSIPWLFQKHILRSAMQELLPTEIISRPKTPLGDLSQAILNQPENSWVDDWLAESNLHNYISRDAIPAIKKKPWDGAAAYVNLRPLLLNTWMAKIN